MQTLKYLVQQMENMGLSDKEKIVYVSLFRLGGQGFPSAIAKEAHINRSTCYKTLTSLAIKGLVSDVEKNKKVFYILSSPEKLLSYIEYQHKDFNKKMAGIKKAIPHLTELFSSFGALPKISIFNGYSEIKEIYFDMLRYKNYEMSTIFNAKAFDGYLSKQEQSEFTKGKLSQKITMRALVPDDKYGNSFAENVYGFMKNTRYFPQIRKVNKEIFPWASEMTLYGKNKIAMFKLGKQHEDKKIIGVVIEDEAFYGMIKMVFDIAWGMCANKIDNSF